MGKTQKQKQKSLVISEQMEWGSGNEHLVFFFSFFKPYLFVYCLNP
jgi:hypothetical protein